MRARFDPSVTGAKSATVTIASNAANVVVALTGFGHLPTSAPGRDPDVR